MENKNIYNKIFEKKCAVCGSKYMADIHDQGECSNCGWYNGKIYSEFPDNVIFSNLVPLNKAIKLYKENKPIKPDLDDFLEGPNAILFGASLLEPIKIISEFAKSHDKLDIRVGVISGDVADLSVIKEYASIPSREGLLTMLAGGMMQYVKDLAISLNLYAEQMEGKE